MVLATHGRGAISRLWLGSVSDALVRRLTVPVLLIRPTEGTAVLPAERFRKVFVALDGSTESESAMSRRWRWPTRSRADSSCSGWSPPVPIIADAGMSAAMPVDDEGLTEMLWTRRRPTWRGSRRGSAGRRSR